MEVSEEAEHARMLICPRLELAQVQFMLTCPAATEEDKVTAKDTLMAAVKESNMAPFYKHLCEQYGWMEDEALTAAMQKTNAAELVKLEVRKPIKTSSKKNKNSRQISANMCILRCRVVPLLARSADRACLAASAWSVFLPVSGSPLFLPPFQRRNRNRTCIPLPSPGHNQGRRGRVGRDRDPGGTFG